MRIRMVVHTGEFQKDRRPMGAQRMTRKTLSPGIHARKGGDCGRRSPEKFALLFWPGEGRYRVRILPFTGREKIVAACYRSNLAAPLIVEDAPNCSTRWQRSPNQTVSASSRCSTVLHVYVTCGAGKPNRCFLVCCLPSSVGRAVGVVSYGDDHAGSSRMVSRSNPRLRSRKVLCACAPCPASC